MSRRFDLHDDSVVVIVGSGAGGGTLAAALSEAGIGVVCLEAGRRVPIEQDLTRMFRPVHWSDRRIAEGDLNPRLPTYISKTVGGTALLWGGLSMRRQPWELSARSTYGAIGGADLVDWPVSYEELVPWYERAERRLNVTGRHGAPFLPDHNHSLVFKAGARRIGYRQVSNSYMAINTGPYDGRPGCRQMGFCAAGCIIGAKWSPYHAELPRAMATGRFDLRESAMAIRLEHDGRDRVTGVVYLDAEGREQRQRARAVCLAANAIETPRLLLMSESARFPDGLANRSGMVGRYYMMDVVARAAAILPGRVDNYKGTTYSGLVEDENRHDPSRGLAGGLLFGPRGIHLPLFPNELDPQAWGGDYAAVMERYRNAAAAVMLAGDMPVADNRVTLDDTEKDAHGLPVPRIRKVFHANDNAILAYGLARLTELFEALGAHKVYTRGEYTALHNLGTCRQGATPEAGVCNGFGQTHDLANLFVSDGSQFPTTGAAPPTLTIVTRALRQADYIAREMNARAI